MHSNGDAIYKYGASDKAYQHLRANNLLMWEAIKRFVSEGCRQLCLGRTERENEGLRQFKAGWGRETSSTTIATIMAADAFVPGKKTVSNRANQVFSRMPIPALKTIGGLLYRHMG